MKYQQLLEIISTNENLSVKEIENEMAMALKKANIECSPQQFINCVALIIKDQTYKDYIS